MAIKKSQLYSTLWESCNALRGGMDASQYKDYVLMVLFVKYLSDKAHLGQMDLDVPEGCYFEDFVALKQNEHIGELINKKLEAIREANTAFIGGLTLPNFNDDAKLGSGKTKVETLSKLIAEFERDELDFSRNRAADDDLLGDAYEYLMKNFAAESGKSKGQFYTPAEVSRVIAKVLHMEDFTVASNTIYDMTCGSGSLLLRALSETPEGKPKLYGQEKDSTTASLAKLNMLLHGVVNADIQIGDTLNDPQFTVGSSMLRTFDVCVANPPFSQKNWLNTNGEYDVYNRWNPSLLAPAKCGDFAFLQHLIASMKADTGRGACILPHGVLFRGNAEYNIRKDIVDKHYLKGIIGLPPNLFFGTGIPACILILDKKDAHLRPGIFIIDAKEGFTKNGNMNRLREQDIKRIVDAWNAQEDIPHYARMVTWNEVEQNDYNLNIPRYIPPRDTEVHHDIDAHLHGGIPQHDVDALSRYWDACPTLLDALFALRPDHRYDLKVKKEYIGETISCNDSFDSQEKRLRNNFRHWCDEAQSIMEHFRIGIHPKEEIAILSESLFQMVKNAKSLADPYSVYERLMNYWEEAMQDDCYMISNDGWKLSYSLPKKGIYSNIVCDLLPVGILLLNNYFAKEYNAIGDAVQAEYDKQREIDDEADTILDSFGDYFDNVTEATVKKAVKDANNFPKGSDEHKVLENFLKLCKDKKNATSIKKTLEEELTQKVMDKYEALKKDENEVRSLVVNKKWLSHIKLFHFEEMHDIAQRLTAEVTELVTRYENTLPDISADVLHYEQEVNTYLKDMGFTL